MVDNKALGRLLAAKKMLSRQQYKTLKGQILAGNSDGAMRGLARMIEEFTRKYDTQKTADGTAGVMRR